MMKIVSLQLLAFVISTCTCIVSDGVLRAVLLDCTFMNFEHVRHSLRTELAIDFCHRGYYGMRVFTLQHTDTSPRVARSVTPPPVSHSNR